MEISFEMKLLINEFQTIERKGRILVATYSVLSSKVIRQSSLDLSLFFEYILVGFCDEGELHLLFAVYYVVDFFLEIDSFTKSANEWVNFIKWYSLFYSKKIIFTCYSLI